MNIGNAVHVTGFLFGMLVAGCFVRRYRPRLLCCGLVGIVTLSIIPLFWCPWSVSWLSTKAYTAQTAGRYVDAIELYDQIIRLRPTDTWAYQNRSQAYDAVGDRNRAHADLQQAHKLDPTIEVSSIAWLMHQAYDAHAAGKLNEALDHYSQVIRRDPTNVWAYLNRSGIHLALGDSRSSGEDLSKAHEIDPATVESSAVWLYDTAHKAHLIGEFVKALDLYSQIIRLEPENVWAYSCRSKVYQAMGNSKRAREDWLEANQPNLSIDENNY